MQTLSEKIIALEAVVEENENQVEVIKEKAKTDLDKIKEHNKSLRKVIKKLKDTEASIASIFEDLDSEE